jgi:thioredoxin reductase
MPFDALIVGAGPAGLSAALALGRARKRVLVCDSGPRRNQAAIHIQNFVTRDGTPPDEFRRIAAQQLASYPNVEFEKTLVDAITGERGSFQVTLGSRTVETRRVLLCTGMIDQTQTLAIEGFAELWGHSIFQCPYCHGWEVQDLPWGCLVSPENASHVVMFASMLRGWTRDLIVFASGNFEVSVDTKVQLESLGIRIETSPVVRLLSEDMRLEAVELANGQRFARKVLFAHPPQEQVRVVRQLGLVLDEDGFVKVDPMRRETSIPGIYAAGDLTTRAQGAVLAAADGVRAAGMINVELTTELLRDGHI